MRWDGVLHDGMSRGGLGFCMVGWGPEGTWTSAAAAGEAKNLETRKTNYQ